MAPPPTQDIITVKVPAPPPCSVRATNGSKATSAVLCKKNRKMRSKITFRRGDCAAKLKPTRMAPTKRSPGSALVRGVLFQRRINVNATAANRVFSTNTAAGLKAASNPPANTGPITRDRFMAMPLSDNAAGKSSRDTICGTMAANTGQRMARPMPLLKVSSSNHCAVSWPLSDIAASTRALTLTHSWVAAK